jgi:hypothetical protein
VTLDDAQAEIDSLKVNVDQLHHRVRLLEKYADTWTLTPWWKRALFVLDGWPTHKLADRPQWRPWRKWWAS